MKQGLFALLLVTSVFIAGCGNSSPGPDPNSEAKRLENAKQFREFFNKANGNYSALSTADKASYLKLVDGDEKKGEIAWNQMKYGPGGAPPGAPASR